MKKIIFLLGFCCMVSALKAQEFCVLGITTPDQPECHKNVMDKEINDDPEEFLSRRLESNNVERLAAFNALREEWIRDRKEELLTPALDSLLSDSVLMSEKFSILIYFNPDGSVFTLEFWIEESIYNRLPNGWLKDTFNKLMREKLNASEFWNFSTSKFWNVITNKEDVGFGMLQISVTDLKKGVVPIQADRV